jgi:hypothetical protein
MATQPLCCWCVINRVETRLDADSRCPVHGLVRDRLLGFVRMDVKFLTEER